MMLKSFNIYELDYKRIHFIASADSFQREIPSKFSEDSQTAFRWNPVTSRVKTRCYRSIDVFLFCFLSDISIFLSTGSAAHWTLSPPYHE